MSTWTVSSITVYKSKHLFLWLIVACFHHSQSDFCPHNSWPIGARLWSFERRTANEQYEWVSMDPRTLPGEQTEETLKKTTKGRKGKQMGRVCLHVDHRENVMRVRADADTDRFMPLCCVRHAEPDINCAPHTNTLFKRKAETETTPCRTSPRTPKTTVRPQRAERGPTAAVPVALSFHYSTCFCHAGASDKTFTPLCVQLKGPAWKTQRSIDERIQSCSTQGACERRRTRTQAERTEQRHTSRCECLTAALSQKLCKNNRIYTLTAAPTGQWRSIRAPFQTFWHEKPKSG